MGNFLFLFMLIFSVIVSVSSSSWMVCWMMMEISSFFFVPILYKMWSLSSVMIGLKYFIVQSFGSSIFLFSVFWESYSFGGLDWFVEEKSMGLITCFSMMLKLGVFPFTGWMIQISENLSWKSFFLLSSIQEIIPLVMISKFGGEELIFYFLLIGMIILVMMCYCNYSVHWMMMISSLFNVSWMVAASMISKESLVFFIFVYFSTLYVFFWVLDSAVSVKGLSSSSSFSIFGSGKVVFIFVSFMMMGIPPFGNFLGKVEVLMSMIEMDMFWIGFFFLLMSSIFMFLYLKVSLSVSLVMKGGLVKEKVSYMGIVFMGVFLIFFFVWIFCF